MIFEEYYKLPFQNTNIGIVDKNYHKVADWLHGIMSIMVVGSMGLSETDRQHVVDCLNGNYIVKGGHHFTYDKEQQLVLCDEKPIMRIRGWGHLTGTGGFNLLPNDALKIQDELGEFIVKQLSKK